MKGIKLRSTLFAGAAALLALFPNVKKSSLKDIAKPHLGVYECTDARLNDKDYLDYFSSITLELKTGDEFVLYYTEKGGKQKTETGKYLYDREDGTVTLIGGVGGFFKREFPLKEGVLTIDLRVGVQKLSMRFEHK